MRIRVDNWPIERKLITFSLTASAAALFLAFFGFSGYEIVTSHNESIDRLDALTAVTAENSAAALAFGDSEAAHETLRALSWESGVDGACIYSRQGELFASYNRAELQVCPPRHSGHSFKNERTAPDAGRIYATWSIDRDGDELGHLLIVGNRNEFRRRLSRYSVIAILVLGVSCLVTFALSRRLQRLISGPILDLVQAANAVRAERVYSRRVHKRGEDECGLLVDAFNDMLSEIDRRDRGEQLRGDRLEDEVTTRTADLRRANQELESEIAERRRAEEALRYEAFHDSLTGLGNRALLMSRLDEMCQAFSADRTAGFALLFLDLDGFKLVNDSLGHTVGDQLLARAAQRLASTVGPPNLVARLGGDEFAILLSNLNEPEEVYAESERILSCFSEPFALRDREIFINGSIGAVTSSLNSCTPEKLLRDADAAMYRAKAIGKATVAFFDIGMASSALDKLELRNDLQRALDRDELLLEYQPICSATTGVTVGCEALVRWRHPIRGVLSPDCFIGLSEEMGLVHRLGEWVLRRACAQNAEWQARGFRKVYVSVNVSALQIRRDDFVGITASALEKSGLEPRWLKLELTETVLMEGSDFITERLRSLDHVGVRIAVDDFGTGYSSLNYLRHWPIHTLKIDRSFIAESRNDRAGIQIVSAIATMAQALGLNIIAEGVEVPEQLHLIRSVGCHQVQGYLFGKPMSPENFVDCFLMPSSERSQADLNTLLDASLLPARSVNELPLRTTT